MLLWVIYLLIYFRVHDDKATVFRSELPHRLQMIKVRLPAMLQGKDDYNNNNEEL